ncbi:MAG: sugar ABC transporter ATP-binding protein [Clostridia bacterium]|nr:sugar ABC transporter ATP-binding protein [Clostridia bacterium]MBT7121559.1 sugar ABC transporter ATP-binding protein [Clostridia bacterium]
MSEFILEMKNIGKSFSGVSVLRNINLGLVKGEVHALLGENGAGKSTLIKIISGFHPTEKTAQIILDGKRVAFKKPKDALDASIHTIYQELTLCPDMTVAENIVIDKQDRFKGVLQHKKQYNKIARDVLNRMEQKDIRVNAMVRTLSIAQQQVVEIAKAIASDAKVILMDEPTSSISQEDADELMNIIRHLRDQGVTIIYISHRLHEIDGIADRISVLRDGDLVGTVNNKDVTENDLINMMVGRQLKDMFPKRDIKLGDVVLSVKDLESEKTFKNVSFEVHKGEIFGIGGLVGAKRTEVLEALYGLRKITGGQIELNGKKFVPRNPINAMKHKIAFVTEDRKKSGLVLCLSVMENLNMINAQEKTPLGTLSWKKLMGKAKKQQDSLDIRIFTLKQIVDTLSGGNQQKVALGKWMEFKPDILLFDEPTRGIDIGAKTEIYNIMGELAAAGTAIIMVSSELPELISMADNIMVMREGVMKGVLNRSEATQEAVMTLAALKD